MICWYLLSFFLHFVLPAFFSFLFVLSVKLAMTLLLAPNLQRNNDKVTRKSKEKKEENTISMIVQS
jgi:hypothetical protein